jgi:hypothetical protein
MPTRPTSFGPLGASFGFDPLTVPLPGHRHEALGLAAPMKGLVFSFKILAVLSYNFPSGFA